MRALVAIVLANLPTRWWALFDERYPLARFAWLAGLGTMLAGLAIGIPGYLEFMQAAADAFNTAIGANPELGIKSSGWGLASLPIFMFGTPTGLISTYLGFSGFLRATSAYVTDDPRGDPLLTAADAMVRAAWTRLRSRRARLTRAALEGPEVRDRVVSGRSLGRPDIELAVVASRKRDWPRGAYLVTRDGAAFRIGESFDLQTRSGLRAVYPLTELTGGEAIRHAIPYDVQKPGSDPNFS